MSASDLSAMYSLEINVDDEYRYLVKILLFGSDDRIISPIEQSIDSYSFQVKKGLYTVRVEMNGSVNDKIITVNSAKEYLVSCNSTGSSTSNIIEPPKQYSSALLSGENIETYNSSHNYYIKPAIEFSVKNTFMFNAINASEPYSSLFIFMRFPSVGHYKKLKSKWERIFYQDFEIVDEYGERIIHFESGNGIEVNEHDGWVAFNAKLPNGIYYLIYHGPESRQVPIYVFKNWHTQFFMTFGTVPLFGSIRIFISKERKFDPKEKTNKFIDILLDKLQNGDYSVDEGLIEMTAYGKYESPMLGLICSYVYFKSLQNNSDNLFNIISQNMRNVILKDNDESPDLRALEILSANHTKKSNYKKTAVKGTPMLRVGFEAIKSASTKDRNLIPKNGVNDFISETLFYDSPFNTFEPIPFYKKEKKVSAREIGEVVDLKALLKPESIEFRELSDFKMSEKPVRKEDRFSMNIRNLLNPKLIGFIKNPDADFNSESSWVKNSISDLLNSNENININEISSQLNLSGNTITRIFDNWGKELKGKK